MSLLCLAAAFVGLTCAPSICQPGHAASLRLPFDAYREMRDVAFARAHKSVSQQCHRNDERPDCLILDHILPLELCSERCNEQSNLQIQSRVDAAAKDILENRTTEQFCRGDITLEAARARFR